MKFKKKAAKVSMLLGFMRSSPVTSPRQQRLKALTRLGSYLDEKIQMKSKKIKKVEIKQGEKRFDRIVGNKEVYFAHSLNYIYIDSSPVTVWFRLGRYMQNTVQVRISVGGSKNSSGFLGKYIVISLYE